MDECNGIFGPTPEYPNGIYHYHMTIEVHGDEPGAPIKRDIYGRNQGGITLTLTLTLAGTQADLLSYNRHPL